LLKLKSKSKNNKIYKKQNKKRENKNLEFSKEISSSSLQLRDLILRLSSLNLKLLEVINTTKSHILIKKNRKNLSRDNSYIYFNKKKNNAKNYLCVKVSINLRY